MATAALKEELTCSICLNIYEDPISLRCGHSFCRKCIENVPASVTGRSCPECRAEFEEVPSMEKNVSLQNIAGHFLSAQQEKAAAEIFCTYCIGSHVPAVKSCLLCEASLCDDHLRVHSKSTDHILSEPFLSTANRKCSTHEKVLLFYCTQDTTCVCISCSLAGEHKGHQVEPLNEASNKMKKSLRKLLGHLTSKRQKTKRSLQTLENFKTDLPEKANALKGQVTTIFRDIRRQLDFLEKKLFCELSSQEEQPSLSVSELIEQLEIKKEKLSMEIHQIEELCSMMDPLMLLQAGRFHLPKKEIQDDNNKVRSRETDVLRAINGLDEGLIAATLYKGLEDIVTGIKRKAYVPVDLDIVLDTNTAANTLEVSQDLRFAFCATKLKNQPKTPERFQYHQVLSSRSFSTGQHYWEVKVGKTGIFRVGVAYPTTQREGTASYLGNNEKSWALHSGEGEYSFYYNKKCVTLPHKPSSQRLAIYLDYEAGQLSFYEMNDPIIHLYTTKTTFTEPVHQGFVICENCWFRLLP